MPATGRRSQITPKYLTYDVINVHINALIAMKPIVFMLNSIYRHSSIYFKEFPMKRGLLERLNTDGVICAEGYLFEMERRGYLTAGEFVPEVALDNPEVLRTLHKEFQHAGSDVIEAFTYNAHREKMRIINKEDLLEPLNRNALKIAREVAASVPEGKEPNLVAGNISNSNIWNPEDKVSQRQVREMFEEMVGWADQ